MNIHSIDADELMDEIASCLSRVREHIYRANVGAAVVETGRRLFDAGPAVDRGVDEVCVVRLADRGSGAKEAET